jgi:hypothetical protein
MKKHVTENQCEIEGCGRVAAAQVNGIAVCDRCRLHFVSAGAGAVWFGGRWHGVLGAMYAPIIAQEFPGLKDEVSCYTR